MESVDCCNAGESIPDISTIKMTIAAMVASIKLLLRSLRKCVASEKQQTCDEWRHATLRLSQFCLLMINLIESKHSVI